jgi:hypothetical protein
MMKIAKFGWRNRSIVLSAICVAIFIVLVIPSCMYAGRAPEPTAPPVETTTVAPTEPTSFVPSPHIHDFNDFGECRYCGYIQ